MVFTALATRRLVRVGPTASIRLYGSIVQTVNYLSGRTVSSCSNTTTSSPSVTISTITNRHNFSRFCKSTKTSVCAVLGNKAARTSKSRRASSSSSPPPPTTTSSPTPQVNQTKMAVGSAGSLPPASPSTPLPAAGTTAAKIAAEAVNSNTWAGLYARTRYRGPVSWQSLFLVGVAAASSVAYYQIERERRLEAAMGKVVSTGKPAIGGPWSAVDLDGNLVTNKSFEGKWLLLYFGFARCPDICPSEMMKVARVMDTMKKDYPELEKMIVPVFVSIDPARDSIKALKEYAKDFHPSYIFLTGSPTQIRDMAKKYRVYFSKADETADGDYLVDHSIVIYFHDDTGDLADCFTQSMRPSDLVEKMKEHMTAKPKVAF